MANPTHVDALVVGAGFAGIYATYRLARMGLTVQCIDLASDVGGTWYHSRYPGAMSDTESYLYRYSWDKEDLQTYPWTHHYLCQPEILEYLRHIVKKHDLRRYMRFNTEMAAAAWEDDHWRVTCVTGQAYIARYLVNAMGILAKANYPNIVGVSSFAGRLVHTAKWPDDLDLRGKKVGIIGNGSTGTQVMTAIAPLVGYLKSFQRHPQYSVPSGQKPVSEEYRQSVNRSYDQIWDNVWSSAIGFGVPESQHKAMAVSSEERRKAFQQVWDQGNGFRFMFSAFGDIATDREANEEACKFIRSKIDEIVKDPSKAQVLKPTELYARRPLCDSGYYEIFNRDNVDVFDLKANPIEEIVPEGMKMTDGTVHELDVLIFATGFDAIEGSYMRVQITGRDGVSLQDHWANRPTAYGGVACSGFPNMFIILGPHSPFANVPPVIESEINLIMACIEHAEEAGKPPIMEVTREAEQSWVDICDRLSGGSLFKTTSSWIFGTNIPGRRMTTNLYFAGLKSYLDWVTKEIQGGFPGFQRGPPTAYPSHMDLPSTEPIPKVRVGLL
ncbi:flavin-containing monooxygenase [Aspergillus undulatus]|uniref:flavin-containing monooxygenase n=1 Tax=Aspergillus undulatus TaxID=1810928 RepID=UPI003CCE3AD7